MSGGPHLIAVVGTGSALLPHLIEHYRSLGIDSFRLIRHAEAPGGAEYERIGRIVADAGLELHGTHIGPWDEELNARLIREVMSSEPDDWFAVADGDEFHVHDRPLDALIAWCERNGYDAVGGCFLDRVAAAGDFPAVPPTGGDALWERFPLAGNFSYALLGATPTKVVLARGHVPLELGQHSATVCSWAPHREVYSQVHHFKWTEGVDLRLRRRKEAFQSGRWNLRYPAMVAEALRFADHAAAHGGRIDVAEPLFAFHPCGAKFGDYPHWPQLAQTVHLQWPAGW